MVDKHDWDAALEEMKQVEEKIRASQEVPIVKKKSGRGRAILLVGVLLVIAVVVGVLAATLLNPTPEVIVEDIPGDPANFDAPSSLQEVQQFAGDDVRFLSLTMAQVRSDGTIDLGSTDNPSAEYVFVRGSNNGRDDNAGYEYVIVNISEQNMTRTTQPVPADDVVPERVVPPNCTIEQLWGASKTYEVPSNTAAWIQYNHDGYHFVIDLIDIDMQFNEDCILIRS